MSKAKKVAQTQTEEKRESNATLFNEAQVAEQIKAAVAEALAAKKRVPKEKKEKAEKKAPKGIMIEFTNQKGQLIRGLGNLYYVVRFEKKLHYKAIDAVRIIPAEELTVPETPPQVDLIGTPKPE